MRVEFCKYLQGDVCVFVYLCAPGGNAKSGKECGMGGLVSEVVLSVVKPVPSARWRLLFTDA